MSMTDNQQQSFPNMPAPLVDERRFITESWRYLLINLWRRTGGASGGTVVGPTSSTSGNVPTFANDGGTALADSGYDIGTTGHSLVAADGLNVFTAVQRMPAGAVGAPGLAIGAGANGFYAPSAGQIGVTLLGVLRMLWAGATATYTGSFGATVGLNAPTVLHTAVAFASLPAGVLGMVACVSDSNNAAPAWGDTVTGGGSGKILVYYNGTNWTAIGK